MSSINEKVTAPHMSAATDNRQSLSSSIETSISEREPNINDESDLDDLQDYLQMISSPDYLYTISLTELYDTAYRPKMKIVDNLICSGAYLFAGAPKVGKSFLMAQLGYHVSRGVPLWEYPVHKGTVLYLALEDDYA
ncbi:MAG: AAA family ATPase, partial [Christensenellales bacterium]